MHAIFLTFEFNGEDRDLPRTVGRFAEKAPDEPGVASCTWLKDGSTIGAFYVFQNVETAEKYLNGAHLRALVAHPGVYDFYIRHFSTLGAISAALPSSPSLLQSPEVGSGHACALWQADMDAIPEQQSV